MTTRTHSSKERLEKSTDINGELERKGKERSSISANEVSAANTIVVNHIVVVIHMAADCCDCEALMH